MPGRKGYEVIRFIEKGDFCHISLDYTEGETLYDWIMHHKEIDKELLYIWFRELLQQLSMFHKQHGAPLYKCLTPWNVIITRQNRIALLPGHGVPGGRKQPLMKHFRPPGGEQNIDVYCLGKMIQFIMAHIRCEPRLSKKEEFVLLSIVRKCLETSPKKQYKSIHMIQKNFRKINIKAVWNKKLLVVPAVILTAAVVFLFSAKTPETSEAVMSDTVQNTREKNWEETVTRNAEEETKRLLIGEEQALLSYEAGIDYFLEEDYQKSIRFFEYAERTEEKARLYKEVAELMYGGINPSEMERPWERLREILCSEEGNRIEEILAFVRVCVKMEWKEEYKCVAELVEKVQNVSEKDGLEKREQRELEEYKAVVYGELGMWDRVVSSYTLLCEGEVWENDEEKKEEYKKKSLEAGTHYLESVWEDGTRDEEDKKEELQKMITEYPDIVKESVFQEFVKEKKIDMGAKENSESEKKEPVNKS